MMKPVLYITYDGLLDPLGQSQVLPYVLRLGEAGVHLLVLSYEKPAQWNQPARADLRQSLAARGVVWYALKYHKTPALLAKSYDLARGLLLAIVLIATRRVAIVHARSYVAAVMALVAKQLTGCKFLFDMRGLWVDERVDGHWWRPDSPLFRIAKRFEASFLRHADHVVVLTTGLKALLPAFPVMKHRPELPISVIPTCVDLHRFHGCRRADTPQPSPFHDQFTYVYLGSVGALYLMSEVVSFFRVALEGNPRALLLVMTNGPAHGVQALLAEHGIRAQLGLPGSPLGGVHFSAYRLQLQVIRQRARHEFVHRDVPRATWGLRRHRARRYQGQPEASNQQDRSTQLHRPVLLMQAPEMSWCSLSVPPRTSVK